MKLTGVIFDMNGVIIDDYPLQREAWNQMSVKLRGLPVTDDEMVNNIRGIPTREIIKWMTGGALSDQVDKLAREKDGLINDLFATSPLFFLNMGLEEFLNQLKLLKIPITIATSSTQTIFSFTYNKLRLNRWFSPDKILFNDGTYPGKPAPDPYIKAAKLINLDPAECYVIEDAKSGIQSAFAAGVRNIIAIGNDERLAVVGKLPGVVRTIHNFNEIKAEELFNG